MKPMQKLANITKIGFQETPEVGSDSILVIEGYFSDPLWEIKRESTDINETTNQIIVKIWVSRDPSLMAAQVTKDFSKEIKITIPHAGKWKIQANDKNLEIDID